MYCIKDILPRSPYQCEVPVHDCCAVWRPDDRVSLLISRSLPVDVAAAETGHAGHEEDDEAAHQVQEDAQGKLVRSVGRRETGGAI